MDTITLLTMMRLSPYDYSCGYINRHGLSHLPISLQWSSLPQYHDCELCVLHDAGELYESRVNCLQNPTWRPRRGPCSWSTVLRWLFILYIISFINWVFSKAVSLTVFENRWDLERDTGSSQRVSQYNSAETSMPETKRSVWDQFFLSKGIK